MALQYSTTHRTNVMTDIVTQASTTGYVLIYSGTEPVSCATATTTGNTLLASLPCSNPVGTVTNGVLTFSAITQENAAATGTATFWRLCTTSAGTTVVAQGTCGVSGADMNFTGSASITAGQPVSISSWTITAYGA